MMPTMTDKHMTDKTTLEPDMIDEYNNRQQQLESWLQHVFVDQSFVLDSLPGDASARRYHRIQFSDNRDMTGVRYIVMDSADEQDAMRQFISVAKLMSPAINVPTFIAQDLDKGFLVLQDFGTVEFAHLLIDASDDQINEHYQLAMQTLADLQTVPIDTAKLQYQLPDYDTALLAREMALFSEWFMPYIGVDIDEALWDNLTTALINDILQQPKVVVHRDYHSRNLMQDQMDKSQLGVIDFQDAVIGSYTYDLVSLLRDAYVDWSERQISAWTHDFWQLQQQKNLPATDTVAQLENDINVMGVQRHLKVLGIFIRLSERDGKDRYLADIPKVMRDLLTELNWLAEQGNDDIKHAVIPFNQWLQNTVLPAYNAKFA